MNDVLRKLYNACDPLKPATPEYYVDCSDVRGSNAFTTQFQRQIALDDSYHSCLFSGHIGSGKSSELEHLRHELENCPPDSPHKRYFPILLNATDYLDDYDVTPTDILLAVVAEMAATLEDKLQIKLKDNYFVKRFDEIKKILLNDWEIKEGELPLWGAKMKLQSLKRDPEARKRVRDMLLPQMTTLRHEINTVFDEARLRLKQHRCKPGEKPYADFVLVLDNLEKIQRLEGFEEGTESQRELFLEKSPQLTGLNAHVVYTVPLTLARSHGPQLIARYGSAPFVLPMIKVEERETHAPYEKGREKLRDLLQKRAGEVPLEELFTPTALDWLITYSGGHARDLMQSVQAAITYNDAIPPIPLKAAQRALNQRVALFSTSLSPVRWRKLALLECSPDQQIDPDDADYRMMLEQICILEYINGGVEENPFDPAAPWYAVNPIVRELTQFKTALAQVQKEQAQQTENAASPAYGSTQA